MKISLLFILIVIVYFPGNSQDLINDSSSTLISDESSSEMKTEEDIVDSIISEINNAEINNAEPAIETIDDSAPIDNPFVPNENNETITSDNPFLDDGEQEIEMESNIESYDESMESSVNILVDLSLGLSYSKFFINPEDLNVKGKPGFCFNPGIMLHIKKWMFASVSVRYMNILVDMFYSNKTVGFESVTTINTDIKETMNFVTFPIKIGTRFEFNSISPYFYANIEPAYLTASSQFKSTTISTLFLDGAKDYTEKIEDIETIDSRERYHLFLGLGLGAEISYGYGSVYLDGGFSYGLKDTDTESDDFNNRNSSKLLYFPISLGIRFFL